MSPKKPSPPGPGGGGKEPDRQNEPNKEKNITPDNGYGTSGPEADHYKEKGVDLYGDDDPDITLSDKVDADAHFSQEKIELGFSVEEEAELLDTKFVDVSVSDGVDVGIHLSPERISLGLEATLAEIEGDVGTSGNQVTGSVGLGYGGGFDVVNGEDSDGDGQWEIGGSLKAKWGVGGSVSFRVEPEAVMNRAKEAAGAAKDWLGKHNPFGGDGSPSPGGSFVNTVGRQASGMRRLDEAFARLQSLL